MWPVPVEEAGWVYVRAGGPIQPADIILYDVLGRAVSTTVVGGGNTLVLDSRAWAKGTYYLQITDNKQVYRRKLVK